ncbi:MULTISPECIES: ABC transporter permease [unclassified Leucobacter]|uniref:ABC transporter permease n=1 Tax=unclassified Leucobacter TaxID=2621730 RepID=UPI00165D3BAB|nr:MULTISPECIES: ABC transporter permease [unclassified Leucobacter]MBC9936220.1 ABC transporter permease [Leucobacter sp. cx-87]
MQLTESLTTLTSRARPPWLQSGWIAFGIRRAGGLLFSLALLVVITFLIVPLLPGDPAVAILGTKATPEAVEALRDKMGLNDPLPVQFLHYLGNIFQGELGTSFRYGIPVNDIIATKLPYTAALAFGSIIAVLVVAIPLGMAVGVATGGGKRAQLATSFGTVAGFLASFPAYVAGTLLVMIFAIWLRVLPAGGVSEPGALVLPIAALAFGPTFAMARIVRQETYTVLQQDFMRTARGHRLKAIRLYIVHALPNLMSSTLTLTGLILAGLIGGTIIIESVFSYPGLGLEVVQSIIYKDFPNIQGIILVIGFIAIVINLLVDIILGLIDPRTLEGPDNG